MSGYFAYVCIYVPYAGLVLGKAEEDIRSPLELVSEMVVSFHVGARNQTQSPARAANAPNPGALHTSQS